MHRILPVIAAVGCLSGGGCVTLFDDDLPPPPALCGACEVEPCPCPDGGADAMACLPAERCNGADDDCDGRVDEDAAAACGEAREGRLRCVAGRCELVCNAGRHDIDGDPSNGCEYSCTPNPDRVETCDGADDDCDGVSDEGLIGNRVIGLEGVCTGARQVCQGQAGWGEPRFEDLPGFELVEGTCDGLDNDCDGETDEAQAPEDRCTRCDGVHAAPPCNGCPDGVVVPGGWICAPAGDFVMGSDGSEVWFDPSERPPQPVRITGPLLVMRTEVTQAQWMAVMAGNPAYHAAGSAQACDDEAPGDCPVERISWFDGITFANRWSEMLGLSPCYDPVSLGACLVADGGGCADDMRRCEQPALGCGAGQAARLDDVDPTCTGLRLPTEAEWEYVARAGSTGLFWFPDARFEMLDDLERLGADGPAPVGGLEANPWGLYDVHGNVSEWTQGWFGPYPAPPPDAADPHRDTLDLPPRGPTPERVFRGGSWFDTPEFARAAFRSAQVPVQRDWHRGLRLVRRPPP